MTLASRAVAYLNEQYRRVLEHMREADWRAKIAPFVAIMEKAPRAAIANSRGLADAAMRSVAGESDTNAARRRHRKDTFRFEGFEPRLLMTTLYWDTSDEPGYQAGSGTWNTSAMNWNDGTGRGTWQSGADAVFPTEGSTSIVTVSGGLTVNSISGVAGAPSLSFSGGALDASAGSTLIISENINMVLGGTLTIFGSTEIRGNISGPGV